MRKTLKDLAAYLKMIIVPKTDEKYKVNSIFEEHFNESDIYEGVDSFRLFLENLFDVLVIEADDYGTCKKVAHEYENRTTLSVYYPFLNNVKTLLMRIGYFGEIEDNKYITCTNTVFNKKLSTSKTLECLSFLTHCGIQIDGINLNDKKQDLSKIEIIKLLYPKDSKMWIGMKIMAIAEVDLGTLLNQDTFLRCDYTILKHDKPDEISTIKDMIKPLSFDVQTFILDLHNRYLDKGFRCVIEIKGYWIYIKYMYKRKDIWGINVSLNNGFHINSKTLHMNDYQETIATFQPRQQEIIDEGFGCGRKIPAIGQCNGGCRGMLIPLDDSIIDLKEDIETWFDSEYQFI